MNHQWNKVGRNDTCPCGSGRKFKKCCLRDAGRKNPSGSSRSEVTLPNIGPAYRALINDRVRLGDTIESFRRRSDELLNSIIKIAPSRIGVMLLRKLAVFDIYRVSNITPQTPHINVLTCAQVRFIRGIICAQPLILADMTEFEQEADRAWASIQSEIFELWQAFGLLEDLQGEAAKSDHRLDGEQSDSVSWATTYGRTNFDMGYPEQAMSKCRDVFSIINDAFVVPTFGISVDRFLDGFPSILNMLNRRINSVQFPEDSAKTMSSEANRKIESMLEITPSDLPDLWSDADKIGFLNAFSFNVPEQTYEFRSPSDDNITLRKPICRLADNHYLLVDPVCCRYAPLALLTHAVINSPYRDKFRSARDEILERRSGSLLRDAVSSSNHYSKVFLPVAENGALAEQDHIIIADGRVFFLECKAMRVRNPASHGGNARKVRDDLRVSICKAYEQGDRARRYFMQQQGEIQLLDNHGRTTHTVDRACIVSAHVIVVTWDPILPLSIDLKPWIEVSNDSEYPWVVCIDDFETALTRLRPASNIAEFIKWRSGLNGRLVSGDELNVVGCYLSGHTEFDSNYTKIVINDGYADIFDDDYFASLGIPREATRPDSQPAVIRISHENGVPVMRMLGPKGNTVDGK